MGSCRPDAITDWDAEWIRRVDPGNAFYGVHSVHDNGKEYVIFSSILALQLNISKVISHKTTRVVKTCTPCMFNQLEESGITN